MKGGDTWGLSTPEVLLGGERCEQDSEKPALLPSLQLGRLLKIPVLKFLLHSASYLWFLIFLLGESLVMETQLSTFRGRSQSVWETSLHMVWVAGTWVRPFICGRLPPGDPLTFLHSEHPYTGWPLWMLPEYVTRPLGALVHHGFPSDRSLSMDPILPLPWH